MESVKKWLNNSNFVLATIALVFVLFRVFQITRPLHQDEYKWPLYSIPEIYPPGSVPHPPLTEYFFKVTNFLFGQDLYRLTPFILSFISLFLLFYFVKKRFGQRVALISSFLFSISFYSILGSLTVDTDGAILTFFALICLNIYQKIIDLNFDKKIYKFIILLTVFALLGLMVKLSFALVIISIFIDFIIYNKSKIDRKHIVYFIYVFFGFVLLSLIFLFISKYLFSGFSLERGIKYWSTFVRGFSDRNFLQTFIQFIKALFYLSPLLVFGSILSVFYKESKFNLFYINIIIGLVFYLVLFDFSIGALDRYLVFLVLPTIILTSSTISKILENKKQINSKILLGGFSLILILFVSQFLSQYVPPLYPKTEWISRIISFKWNFLYPFSGGSGPLGFYISFSFIAFSFLTSLLFVILFLKTKKIEFFILFLSLGLVYNLNFTEEFNLGKLYGYSPKLVKNAVSFIKDKDEIKKVLVYNDNGGFNIRRIDKYERRVYAVPEFESSYKDIFAKFDGYFMFVNVPKLNENTLYKRYIDSCQKIYSKRDLYIESEIFKCSPYIDKIK